MVTISRLVVVSFAEIVPVCGGRMFGRTRHRRHDSDPPFTPDFHRELTLGTRIIICLCDLETVREHDVALVYLCTSELHAYGAFLVLVSRTQLTITEVFPCAHPRTIQTRRLQYCFAALMMRRGAARRTLRRGAVDVSPAHTQHFKYVTNDTYFTIHQLFHILGLKANFIPT